MSVEDKNRILIKIRCLRENDGFNELFKEMHDCVEGFEFEDMKFSVVEFEGGEGQGENCHIVFKVETEGKEFFFRNDGYYASYHGFDWGYYSFYSAKCVEKIVNDWVRDFAIDNF